jgi:uncharacterized protein (TIGR02996 family)
MDADERALMAAIIAHPDEDTPRLIYADWLDEDGRPERAEYIRLSVALANLRYGEPDFWDRRCSFARDATRSSVAPFKAWQDEFAARFPANRDIFFVFQRGFVEGVVCSVKYFLDNAVRAVSRDPAPHVHPERTGAGDRPPAGEQPALRALASGQIRAPRARAGTDRGSGAQAGCARLLARCPHQQRGVGRGRGGRRGPARVRLRRLVSFEDCGLGDPAGLALADAPHLNPERLNLLTNTFTRR